MSLSERSEQSRREQLYIVDQIVLSEKECQQVQHSTGSS